MSIVKRKDSAGRNYYINTNTGKRTTEASYNRSKGAAKSAKTQFSTDTKLGDIIDWSMKNIHNKSLKPYAMYAQSLIYKGSEFFKTNNIC